MVPEPSKPQAAVQVPSTHAHILRPALIAGWRIRCHAWVGWEAPTTWHSGTLICICQVLGSLTILYTVTVSLLHDAWPFPLLERTCDVCYCAGGGPQGVRVLAAGLYKGGEAVQFPA